jgi:hypothetical protein
MYRAETKTKGGENVLQQTKHKIKGRSRVGVSPSLRMETDPIAETLRSAGRWTEPQNPSPFGSVHLFCIGLRDLPDEEVLASGGWD